MVDGMRTNRLSSEVSFTVEERCGWLMHNSSSLVIEEKAFASLLCKDQGEVALCSTTPSKTPYLRIKGAPGCLLHFCLLNPPNLPTMGKDDLCCCICCLHAGECFCCSVHFLSCQPEATLLSSGGIGSKFHN